MILGILIVLALAVLLGLTIMAQSLHGIEPAKVAEPEDDLDLLWEWPERGGR